MAKNLRNADRENRTGRVVEYVSGREYNSLTHQDEKAFVTAADKYVATHITSEKKARSALQKMGIITPTGRLAKHYK